MKVYAGMDPRLEFRDAIAHAQRVERLGYDGLHVAETVHDALAVALIVAEHTERITVRTSVALAFTRSPTLLAYAAWDLAKLSGGRFQLGLGTQIRQNIEDRYAVPFGEDPIARLGDYVGAVRAVFASFASGEPPSYESPYYRVTRMQPYFNPGPDAATAAPPIYLGGVQRRACELAGAIADGFVSHPTNSNPRYLREVCLPALAEGARAAGRDLVSPAFETVVGTQVITGSSSAEVERERERQRRLLAFLYSTPAYAPLSAGAITRPSARSRRRRTRRRPRPRSGATPRGPGRGWRSAPAGPWAARRRCRTARARRAPRRAGGSPGLPSAGGG